MTSEHGKFPNVPDDKLAEYSIRYALAVGAGSVLGENIGPRCVIERTHQLLPHEKGGPCYRFNRSWDDPMTIAG